MGRSLSASGLAVAFLVAALMGGLLWGTALTERGVDQAVRQNFTAAGLLSQLQVEGEKMRRYEKEMFIYVAMPEKRAGYVKEFEGAYVKLLALLDTMQAPSGSHFTEAERQAMAKWKEAALFYTSKFDGLARRAESQSLAAMTPEQRLGLSVSYNDAIKEGKDRFRELLTGTEKMRQAKETQSQNIALDLNSLFNKLRMGMLLGGLVIIACLLAALRARPSLEPSGRAIPLRVNG